ncbi:MAG: hypothetical protein JWN76_3739 [Chitinophagaceae bacterium]|nr:hypothetical protein [Chitinophagaceae bacterium]
MQFLKEHLSENGYNWSPTPKPIILTEAPDRRYFDRFSGDELLYMINIFDQCVGGLTLSDCQHIEKLIETQLPLDIKSRIGVFNWLKGRYTYSWN